MRCWDILFISVFNPCEYFQCNSCWLSLQIKQLYNNDWSKNDDIQKANERYSGSFIQKLIWKILQNILHVTTKCRCTFFSTLFFLKLMQLNCTHPLMHTNLFIIISSIFIKIYFLFFYFHLTHLVYIKIYYFQQQLFRYFFQQ